jgi:hypothetical protein
MRTPMRIAAVIAALAFTGAGAGLTAASAQAATVVGAQAMSALDRPMWGSGGDFIVEDDDFFLFESDDDDCGGW